jgi:hypothetical protein
MISTDNTTIMNKDFVKSFLDDPLYIQGIYNYCDRWCKKCTFTSRCAHYKLNAEQFSDPNSKNINNKLFWQKINELFKVTLELINEVIEKENIDMSKYDTKDVSIEIDKRKAEATNSECSVSANDYIDMVNAWFADSEDIVRQSEEMLILDTELEITNGRILANIKELKERLEVIQWYQYQIYLKINRAVEERLSSPEELKDSQSSYNGSAKVALLGIDNSLRAWEYLMFHFTEKEDGILNILVHLGRLRKKIEILFPDARGFIRPGFDEKLTNVMHEYE